MTVHVFTNAELEANSIYHLAVKGGVSSTTDDPHEGVNYILTLAERIKNERAAMTMHLAAQNLQTSQLG